MTDQKFWISGLAMSALSFVLGFVIHGLILDEEYKTLVGTLFRSPEEASAYFPYMLFAHLLIGFAFTWIYLQGKTAGVPALAQGARFGLAVAALMTVPMYLIYYAVQPMPGTLVAKQIVLDSIAVVLMGVAVAHLNRAPGES
jgi:hypothetical protein